MNRIANVIARQDFSETSYGGNFETNKNDLIEYAVAFFKDA